MAEYDGSYRAAARGWGDRGGGHLGLDVGDVFGDSLLRWRELGLDLGQYLGVRRDTPLSQINVCCVRGVV